MGQPKWDRSSNSVGYFPEDLARVRHLSANRATFTDPAAASSAGDDDCVDRIGERPAIYDARAS
jgi:hypothetical protein